MNEWPTRVRTGVPPCSRIDLGHRLRADEVVQDRRARAACRGSPRRRSRWWSSPRPAAPWSSTRNTRSASPSNASPTSAPASSTARWRSLRFSGWIGSAGWFGNVPSSSPYRISSSNGQAGEDRGHDEAAHAVGGVGHDLQRAQHASRSTKRAHVVGERRRAGRATSTLPARSARSTTPRCDRGLDLAQAGVLADGRGAGQAQLDAVVLGRVVRLAVNIAPGASSVPDGEVHEVGGGQPEVDDVDARRAVTPSANAATSGTDDGRMSRPTSDASAAPVNGRTRCRCGGRSPRRSRRGRSPGRRRP